jgi:prophage regulatory protein
MPKPIPLQIPKPVQAAKAEAVDVVTVDRSHRERLLRISDVCFLTGLGRSTVYSTVKAGDFPRPVQLYGSTVAWRETEVNAWIAARPTVAPAALAKGGA